MPAPQVKISSAPHDVFRAFLNPVDLSTWWGCTAVTDVRVGGSWVGGWGEDAEGLGHGTVLSATISQLQTDELVALRIGEAELLFHFESAPEGTAVRVEQAGVDAATAEANCASWVAAFESLKAWVEQAHPYTPPAEPEAPAAAPTPSPVSSAPAHAAEPTPAPASSAPAHAAEPTPAPASNAPAPADAQGAPGSDPYAAANAEGNTVIDEGGFGVTDPNAVIKSWSKEQGFGYATHAQLGDVSFDYDGCDFEPAVGDQVLLLVIGKRYDGKPKVKRISCPAKGSNIQ